MRLALSKHLVMTVAHRFAQQYPPDKYPADSRWGKARAALEALDLATATATEVAAIIGSKSWAHLICSECDEYVEKAVQFGGAWGESPLTLCPGCARAGAALACVQL